MMLNPAVKAAPDFWWQWCEEPVRRANRLRSADRKFKSAPRTVYCRCKGLLLPGGHLPGLLARSFMSAETVFSVCSTLVLPGWLLLLFLPRWQWTLAVISAGVIPFCLGLVYLSLVVSQASVWPEGGGFGSVQEVA
ncbi:MAG: DUF4281 domain-containing protein, partial [Gammaproteobacteria bacterium]|nr:DUF4281 domain-containing protein [Gammaproteobacteria bacterium]